MIPIVECPGIDLSTDEVRALCDLLELATPSGWLVGDARHPTSVDALLRESGLAALRARGLVEVDTGGARPHPALHELLGVCARPQVLVRVVHRDRDGVRSWIFAVDGDVTVAQRSFPGGVHRFVPLAAAELLERILEAAGVSDDAGASQPDLRLEVARTAYERAISRIIASGEDLLPEAFDGTAGEAFIVSVAATEAITSMTLLHAPDDETTAGGALTWISCGSRGRWIVPEPSLTDSGLESELTPDADEIVEIRTASLGSLRAEIESYLPTEVARATPSER